MFMVRRREMLTDNLAARSLTMLTKFFMDDEGATAIEYGLIAALIAVVIIAALTTLGGNLSTTFNYVASEINTTP